MALSFSTYKIDGDEKIYSMIDNKLSTNGMLELKLKIVNGHFAINLGGMEDEIEGIVINNKKSFFKWRMIFSNSYFGSNNSIT